jgi:hypothetical protein
MCDPSDDLLIDLELPRTQIGEICSTTAPGPKLRTSNLLIRQAHSPMVILLASPLLFTYSYFAMSEDQWATLEPLSRTCRV